MNDTHIDTLDKVRQFLDGTDEVELTISGKKQRYDFIKRTLIRYKYGYLSRQDKGLILQYMARISGYSGVQLNRLAARFVKNGRIPNAEQYLKDDFSFAKLDDIVYEMSDNEVAKLMNKERIELFKTIFGRN